jgi:hypothetical protein
MNAFVVKDSQGLPDAVILKMPLIKSHGRFALSSKKAFNPIRERSELIGMD